MEETKRKRGRPKKVKVPEEIQKLVTKVQEKTEQQIIPEIKQAETSSDFKWDVSKDA